MVNIHIHTTSCIYFQKANKYIDWQCSQNNCTFCGSLIWHPRDPQEPHGFEHWLPLLCQPEKSFPSFYSSKVGLSLLENGYSQYAPMPMLSNDIQNRKSRCDYFCFPPKKGCVRRRMKWQNCAVDHACVFHEKIKMHWCCDQHHPRSKDDGHPTATRNLEKNVALCSRWNYAPLHMYIVAYRQNSGSLSSCDNMHRNSRMNVCIQPVMQYCDFMMLFLYQQYKDRVLRAALRHENIGRKSAKGN